MLYVFSMWLECKKPQLLQNTFKLFLWPRSLWIYGELCSAAVALRRFTFVLMSLLCLHSQRHPPALSTCPKRHPKLIKIYVLNLICLRFRWSIFLHWKAFSDMFPHISTRWRDNKGPASLTVSIKYAWSAVMHSGGMREHKNVHKFCSYSHTMSFRHLQIEWDRVMHLKSLWRAWCRFPYRTVGTNGTQTLWKDSNGLTFAQLSTADLYEASNLLLTRKVWIINDKSELHLH